MYGASRPAGHRTDLISNFEQRLLPSRSDSRRREGSNPEFNEGFLLVDPSQLDLIFIPSDQMDSQHTRHAEPCVHGEIDDDHTDTNENQSISVTPLTPSLLPPTQSSRTITSSTLLPMRREYTFFLDRDRFTSFLHRAVSTDCFRFSYRHGYSSNTSWCRMYCASGWSERCARDSRFIDQLLVIDELIEYWRATDQYRSNRSRRW